MVKLHLGCGQVYLDGWINIDLDSENADLKADLRRALPYPEHSVDFIYSEHLIEHFTAEEGLFLMSECRRLLKQDGVLRIAAPDLTYLLFRYFFFWRRQPWFEKYGYTWIRTRAEMVNIAFRHWGHKYLYNGEELRRRLREAGFEQVTREKRNRSRHAQLRDLETRKESRLIMEAVK